jgi:hypothetical protein
MENHVKISMSNLFSGELKQSNNKNVKFNRIWNSLKWRQAFLNSEDYKVDFEDGKCIVVKQILNGEMKGHGTGTLVWPAAHVLVKYIEKRFGKTGELIGKRVCDIGSGTGITGFAAALLGAEVVLTDQEHLLAFLRSNLLLVCSMHPDIETRVTVSQYDWDVEPEKLLFGQPFDIILVSDCVLPKLYPIDGLLKVSLQCTTGIRA